MTTPTPMTPREIVEALCDASVWAYDAYDKGDDAAMELQSARLDSIKAALVAVLDLTDTTFNDPAVPYPTIGSKAWQALEEACRG